MRFQLNIESRQALLLPRFNLLSTAKVQIIDMTVTRLVRINQWLLKARREKERWRSMTLKRMKEQTQGTLIDRDNHRSRLFYKKKRSIDSVRKDTNEERQSLLKPNKPSKTLNSSRTTTRR
jgi:hypothetical protein